MRITISERLHPFSHIPGVKMVLPKSSIIVEVFPALLRFSDLEQGSSPVDFPIEIVGPVEGFTAQLDLEKGGISVFGKTRLGYLRYFIEKKKEGISLFFDKVPSPSSTLNEKQTVLLPIHPQEETPMTGERLSLGSHKAQDFDLIRRRLDFKEIFPLWLRLGQSVPHIAQIDGDVGNFSLWKACKEELFAPVSGGGKDILSLFHCYFLASFEGLLVPRLFDTQYQGIEVRTVTKTGNPFPLLTEGATLIRALFFREREERVEILPLLPPQFHSGRFVGITSSHGDRFDIEWSKKRIRRLILSPGKTREIPIQIQKGISKCRVRTYPGDRGRICELPHIEVVAGKTYNLDRFES